MYLSKLFKTVQIITFSLLALGCICSLSNVQAQEDDPEMIKLNVKEINEKAGNYGCVPAAAANVLGSWANGAGKDFFPNSPNLSDPSAEDVQALLISLNSNMNTDTNGFTAWYNFAFGIRKTLKDYDVEGTVRMQACTWARAKREIDAGRPFLAGNALNPYSMYYQHFVCVIGYAIYNDELAQEDNNKKYSLLLHDGRGEGETDLYPVDDFFSEFWLPGPIYDFFYNPWFMVTIKLKEHPCDASSSLEFTVSEPEIKNQSATYCDADTIVKNTGPQTIWMAKYVDSSEDWVCHGWGFCGSSEPGEEERFGKFKSVSDSSGECTEHHQYRYIALKDTPQCKDMFNEIRKTDVIPEGIVIREAGPAACECP